MQSPESPPFSAPLREMNWFSRRDAETQRKKEDRHAVPGIFLPLLCAFAPLREPFFSSC